jgi:hypothetical protein
MTVKLGRNPYFLGRAFESLIPHQFARIQALTEHDAAVLKRWIIELEIVEHWKEKRNAVNWLSGVPRR